MPSILKKKVSFPDLLLGTQLSLIQPAKPSMKSGSSEKTSNINLCFGPVLQAKFLKMVVMKAGSRWAGNMKNSFNSIKKPLKTER
jgi:hypothetical protein